MLKKTLFATAIAAGSLLVGTVAEAAVFGNADSTWTNPAPAGNVDAINVNVGGYNSVLYGSGAPSILGFRSNQNVAFEFDEVFTVGRLGFKNTLDTQSSVLDSVDLKLALNFADPVFTAPVVFNMDINSTPDNPFFCIVFGACNPDRVDISPNPLLNTRVTGADGRKYSVDLGFTRDPLKVDEFGFRTSKLKAKVSKVPEPGTVLGLLAVGSLAVSQVRKKQTAA